MSGTVTLTKPQKAAAILVAMGKPTAGKLLRFFKQDELKLLIEGARSLRTIPQSELERIVAEFEAEFAEGVGLLDSADEMDTLLNESFSPEEFNQIMGTGPSIVENGPPPVWPAIEKIEAERLGGFLATEHPQTAALVLSRLKSDVAAGVILTLPKAFRAEVVRRLMSTSEVKPQALRIVEDRLRAGLLSATSAKDTGAGQARVANVLNEMSKDQVEEVMDELASTGFADIEMLRSKLFSFEDIVLLTQKHRVTLFDGISTEVVTTALRGSSAELGEAILSSVGVRARRMIEAELAAGADNVTAEDVNQARKQIASAAIRLASDGVIELPQVQAAA